MKILMVTTYYYPYCSGITEYARRISEELVKKGHQVKVITTKHQRRLKRKEKVNGVDIFRTPICFKLSKGVIAPWFIPKVCSTSKEYDVVNLHLPMMESGLISLLIKKKVIITYHCDLKLNQNFLSKILEKIYYLSAKLSLSLTPTIITYTKDYAIHSKILKHFINKCKFVYPPINEKEFTFKKTNLRKKYKINKEDKVIGFVGRFVYEKGLPYLLKAIPHVLKKYPNSKFVLIGEYKNVAGGSNLKDLESMIDKYKENIILTGNINPKDLHSYYSIFDLLVLPSIDPLEAFGVVQIEAMFCKVPVITTNLPGVRIPITKTKMGLIIKQKDEKAIAKAIISILKNKKNYVKPKPDIISEFNIKKTLYSYEQILKNFQ